MCNAEEAKEVGEAKVADTRNDGAEGYPVHTIAGQGTQEGTKENGKPDGAPARPHAEPRPGEHWQHHPKVKEGEGTDEGMATARKGDHCAQLPATDERLIVSGPYLQLLGYDSAKALWRASVLALSPPARGTMLHAEPSLRVFDEGKAAEVQGLLLEDVSGWKFWRFDFSATLGDQPRSLEYSLTMDGVDQNHRYPVALPSAQQGWRWGFYSCNGMDVDADVSKWREPHLWEDIMTVHERAPLHAFMGGGDQLYNDAVWACPALKAWTAIESAEEQLQQKFTADMERQVSDFYFNHYRVHFNARPALARAFACIPQLNMWDDHDITDGWGSHPPQLQHCPCFQGLYGVAKRFYLLFQHHTTDELSRSMNDLFGPPGTYSFCRQLGARVTLLAPDSRAQRSTEQIISPEAYADIFARLASLPPSVKHLVVVPTVPVVFAKLPLSEEALRGIETSKLLRGVVQKAGLADGILNRFGHVDLLDDTVDHWDANSHLRERRELVERLQKLAKARQLRISFISGDVHVAAVGRLYSRPKVAHLRHDHRFMPQIVSSASWNGPPPPAFVAALDRTNHAARLNATTQVKMVRMSEDNGNTKLIGRRNWCLVEELPLTLPEQAAQHPGRASKHTATAHDRRITQYFSRSYGNRQKILGALVFTLRVEDPEDQAAEPRAYDIFCPQYSRNPLRNRPAVRSSDFLRRCVCMGPSKTEDTLDEL